MSLEATASTLVGTPAELAARGGRSSTSIAEYTDGGTTTITVTVDVDPARARLVSRATRGQAQSSCAPSLEAHARAHLITTDRSFEDTILGELVLWNDLITFEGKLAVDQRRGQYDPGADADAYYVLHMKLAADATGADEVWTGAVWLKQAREGTERAVATW